MTNPEQFPSNSKNVLGAKEPKKDPVDKAIEKVITGEVVSRKKPLGRKFKETFFGGDFKSSARHVGGDVLLPGLRNLAYDMLVEGGKRLLFGGDARSRRRETEYRPRVSYNNPIFRGMKDPRERAYLPDQPPHVVRTGRHEINELIISSKEEAEKVIEMMAEIIDQYQVASVADLYDLVGLPSSYVDNNWGWSYLTSVEIRQVREGWLIDLPAVEPIK